MLRVNDDTHHLYWYARYNPILYRCGVLCQFISAKVFQNLYSNKPGSSTLSFCTAYSILKELGNDALCKYIYENIAEPTFDSHRITNPFPQDFRDYYERMLIAHEDEGDIRDRNIIIARSIGNYLGHNSGALQIEKIGEVASTNMNGEETPTSLWRKY